MKMNDKIESLKLQLKSEHLTANKQKLCKEKEACKLRVTVSVLCEELSMLNSDIDYFAGQLQELKEQISQVRYQIDMVDICTASESNKVITHVAILTAHRQRFDEMFDRDRVLSEMRENELREKEAQELEIKKENEKMAAAKREEQAREAAVIDAECDAIEQACVVLKKRNAAIMLKLRRKLVETEDTRRQLLKSKGDHGNN